MNSLENREIKFEFIVKAKIADKEIHHIDFTFDDLEKCDFSLYDFMYERLESISAEYCGCSISEGNPHCDCDGGGWDGDWEIISRRQYIGRKDKNGVEIYDGDKFIQDVLMTPDGMNSQNGGTYWVPCECKVVFKRGKYCGMYEFEKINAKGTYIDYSMFTNRKGFVDINENIEVIGNIFENPELRNKNHEIISSK